MSTTQSSKPTPPKSAVQSIQRAVAILRCFSESEPELPLTTISQRLDLHKSTVSRILSTLEYEGLISQNPENGRYRLGVGLISLAGIALGRLSVRAAAQHVLNNFAELTKESINVFVLDGNECVVVERAFSPHRVRYMGWIGRRHPLHCTAAGKVLLAYLPKLIQQSHLYFPLTPFTNKTITSWTELKASLVDVREAGVAIVHEEYDEGFSSIAAPLFDHAGHAAGALAISGPTTRFTSAQIDEYVPHLKSFASKISNELGFQLKS